ncbi:DUF1642 domain-containing protein [Lacticaseibacillus paracasei]|uniref:DUF1642 domain-containing protein n=1 Tax=Lacticaseibacillus paracasei TaxID=1597 RepID=UPI0021E9430B|nr:DUF1642 domain-containing protein [Lacticaseibacillus paracasei]UYI59423.1 DUF1642 domain-containing protein [Lacticaseibacillus paracasei]
MSNETKRDMFGAVWNRLAGYQVFFNGWPRETLYDYKKRYDAALPDDMPVIPKAVGEWIKKCKHRNVTLADTLCMEMRPENVRNWMAFKDGDVANDFDRAGYLRKQDLMASAWLLGVWRVEETGEIAKLEEEVRDDRD